MSPNVLNKEQSVKDRLDDLLEGFSKEIKTNKIIDPKKQYNAFIEYFKRSNLSHNSDLNYIDYATLFFTFPFLIGVALYENGNQLSGLLGIVTSVAGYSSILLEKKINPNLEEKTLKFAKNNKNYITEKLKDLLS